MDAEQWEELWNNLFTNLAAVLGKTVEEVQAMPPDEIFRQLRAKPGTAGLLDSFGRLGELQRRREMN